jgi:phosphohistidine swiveling domain-containing protein
MDTDSILAEFIRLFSRWGLNVDDYCFCGEQALLYQGYDVSARKMHFDFLVKSEMLPWKVKIGEESTVPPKGSEEMKILTEFLKRTGSDPHLLPTPLPGIVSAQLGKMSRKIRIKGGNHMRIIRPASQFMIYYEALKEFDIHSRWTEEKIRRWSGYFERFIKIAETDEERRICRMGLEITRKKMKGKLMTEGLLAGGPLKGLPASEGIASGKVRIVSGSEDFAKVEKGDIVVMKYGKTDIIEIIDRISGLITDQGGKASHLAVIAREMGIPCIVGTQRATEVLLEGDEVTMGSDGTIRISRRN